MADLEHPNLPLMTARLSLSRVMPLRELNVRFAQQMQSILEYLEVHIRAILRKIVASPPRDRKRMVRPFYWEVVSIASDCLFQSI